MVNFLTASDAEILGVSDDEFVSYFAGIRNRRVFTGQMSVAGNRFRNAGAIERWKTIAKRVAALRGNEKSWR